MLLEETNEISLRDESDVCQFLQINVHANMIIDVRQHLHHPLVRCPYLWNGILHKPRKEVENDATQFHFLIKGKRMVTMHVGRESRLIIV